MKWRIVAVTLVLVVLTSLLGGSQLHAGGANQGVTHIPGRLCSEAYTGIILTAHANPGAPVQLQYRPSASIEWVSVQATEAAPGTYRAALPAEATAPPGVWYRFIANGLAGTKEYFIQTMVGPRGDDSLVGGSVGVLAVDGQEVFWDIQAKNGALKWGGTASTTSSCPLPTYAAVNSKVMELRTLQPNPHNAVDLNAYKQDVYAMQTGYVCMVGTTSSGIIYVLLGHGQKLRSNPDSYQYYSHYFHLNSLPTLARGDKVTIGAKIGTSGDSGCTGAWHLDCGFDVGATSDLITDVSVRLAMPMKYFFPGIAAWNYGYDLDFVQPPRTYYNQNLGTYVDVIAYPRGTNDSSALTVKLFYRLSGTTTWYSSSMTKQGSLPEDPYRGYFSQQVWSKVVDYYIQVNRQSATGTSLGFVTRPAQYYYTNEAYPKRPSYFYSVTVSPPTSASPPAALAPDNLAP